MMANQVQSYVAQVFFARGLSEAFESRQLLSHKIIYHLTDPMEETTSPFDSSLHSIDDKK